MILRAMLGFGLVAGVSANAFAGFSIVTKGDQTCRVEVGQADSCLPLASKKFETMHPTFEIFQYIKVRERLGQVAEVNAIANEEDRLSYVAASPLTDAQVKYVLDNYQDISARNVGVSDPQVVDGKLVSKFSASIFIKGYYRPLNFTVQIEGELRMDPSNRLSLTDPAKAGQDIGQSLHVTGISDDKTEWQVEELRYLEKAARYINYKIVGVNVGGIEGLKFSAVNAKTIQDAKTIFAPVVFGRLAAEVSRKASLQPK